MLVTGGSLSKLFFVGVMFFRFYTGVEVFCDKVHWYGY
jgi:hypothetical protein